MSSSLNSLVVFEKGFLEEGFFLRASVIFVLHLVNPRPQAEEFDRRRRWFDFVIRAQLSAGMLVALRRSEGKRGRDCGH